MVLKLQVQPGNLTILFYSSVILNGTETPIAGRNDQTPFYSSVILNGTETPTELSVRS